MVRRCLAILFLVLLALLPATGEAAAFGGAGHCAPAVQALAMAYAAGHPAVQQDCGHRTVHRQLPCAMTATCIMAGCMGLPGMVEPQVVPVAQHLVFRVPVAPRLDGLVLAPPLEPPRA